MKIAIIHYWLVGMRGGEKVLEEIASLYPGADIFTHVADPARLSPALAARAPQETFVGRLPFAKRLYKAYLGFMPRALEGLDLSAYDLVISCESGPAKGVLTRPDTRHLCYVHSPMRYIWDQFPEHAARLPIPARAYFCALAHRMRIWDAASAQRVDRMLANSSFVASRVRRAWGRRADVLHPPAELSRFRVGPGGGPYLYVGELTGYKRADLAIEAVRGTRRRLDIIGDGPERRRLERTAPPNVRFRGRLDDAALTRAYGEARALIFPGEEDFGLVPLEALASGRPVIAFGRGGAVETVTPETGVFFDQQTPQALAAALDRFEAEEHRFDPRLARARAELFGPERFRQGFRAAVDELMSAPPEAAWR